MSTRTAKVGGRLYHYYICNRPAAEKKAGGCAQRCIRAGGVEDIVWRFVSDLLKDPDVSGVLCSTGPTGTCRSCFTKDPSIAPLTRKPSGLGVISNCSIR